MFLIFVNDQGLARHYVEHVIDRSIGDIGPLAGGAFLGPALLVLRPQAMHDERVFAAVAGVALGIVRVAIGLAGAIGRAPRHDQGVIIEHACLVAGRRLGGIGRTPGGARPVLGEGCSGSDGQQRQCGGKAGAEFHDASFVTGIVRAAGRGGPVVRVVFKVRSMACGRTSGDKFRADLGPEFASDHSGRI